jgi:flagellar biosynthesis protein FliR
MFDINLGAEALAGFMAASARVGGFLTASPYLTRRLPTSGRIAVVLALSLFLSAPLSTSSLAVTGMVSAVVLNLAAGLSLGLLTSILFQSFSTAGAMVDVASGLSVSAVFDPSLGTSATVFQRFFDTVALVLFFVMGGHRLLVMGLATSIEVVGLDGDLQLDGGLADVAVDLFARYTLASLEIAVPIMATLLVTEVALGIASRLLPQANVFLLGLPLKILVAIVVVGVTVTSFPAIMGWLMTSFEGTFERVLLGLS